MQVKGNFLTDNKEITWFLTNRVNFEEFFEWVPDGQKEALSVNTWEEYRDTWLDILNTIGEYAGSTLQSNADKVQKEDDFEIEGSYDSYYYDSREEEKPKDLEKNMDEFANQVAKKIHTKWYNEKIRDGWRFGQLDVENKMHPMMRPYDELPEEKREIDEELPQMFLDYLKHKGYAVIKQTKLDKLASKGSKT